jgi:hypothetical protein
VFFVHKRALDAEIYNDPYHGYKILFNDLIKKMSLNISIRGYASLSSIRFGHAVTRATALHLATGALANKRTSHTGCQLGTPLDSNGFIPDLLEEPIM